MKRSKTINQSSLSTLFPAFAFAGTVLFTTTLLPQAKYCETQWHQRALLYLHNIKKGDPLIKHCSIAPLLYLCLTTTAFLITCFE